LELGAANALVISRSLEKLVWGVETNTSES